MKNVSFAFQKPWPWSKYTKAIVARKEIPFNRKKSWASLQLQTDYVVANMSKKDVLLKTLI